MGNNRFQHTRNIGFVAAELSMTVLKTWKFVRSCILPLSFVSAS